MKSDILLKGDSSGAPPELKFIERPAVEEISQRHDHAKSLIVSCPFYGTALKTKLKHADLVVVETPSISEVEALLKNPKYPQFSDVVGIGGGVSTDIAKALGVRKDLYIYPTLLSTNCLSNNRSVLGSGLGSFSYPSGNPKETIISFHELMSQSAETRAHWTRAGFGDFVAELSAAIERELLKSGSVSNFQNIIDEDPEVWGTIEWIAQLSPTEIYTRDFMKRFAEILHSTSAKVLKAGGNAERIGSEHDLYKALLTLDPSLRHNGAPHGTITGLGTLLVAKVYEKDTGHSIFYKTLRQSFQKMGMPLTYAELQKLSLDKQKLSAALKLLKVDPNADRYLRIYLDKNGENLLDEVFAFSHVKK